jgi:hypothetical protein
MSLYPRQLVRRAEVLPSLTVRNLCEYEFPRSKGGYAKLDGVDGHTSSVLRRPRAGRDG